MRGEFIPSYWLPDTMFDVTGDGLIDQRDVRVWIYDIGQSLLGDTDVNGAVEFIDFVILAENFGQPGDWADGDFDFSGDVQFSDFLILSVNFGRTSGDVTTIPEPQNVGWLFVLVVLCRRRRN